MSLSRCPSSDASTELQFAISEPTPGLQNSCPQGTFAVGLDLCFLIPSKQSCVPPPACRSSVVQATAACGR